jgi:hypothetical protein
MVTARITVKEHVREYLEGKYNHCLPGTVTLPDREDLYHTVFDLTERRPRNCPADSGNLELALPARREGKPPETYNYIGERSSAILERKIETKFWAELHDMLDENKHRYSIQYIETVACFMRRYCIHSISEDALLKNYYRWRNNVRQKQNRRPYVKKKA